MLSRDVNTTRSCAHGKGWYSVAVTCLACLPPSETSVLALLQLNVTKAGDNDTAMGKPKHEAAKAAHDMSMFLIIVSLEVHDI
jgi:hypothetical protein